MRKPWPTFSTESAGFCLSPPSDSDRLLPVVPTAVRRSLLIMDAKQGFQIEYKRGSMECYFVRYSNWYSNQNTKLILTIIINRINYRFKLPRPTNSKHRQNPPSAGFVVSGVWKAQPKDHQTFPTTYSATGELAHHD